MLFGKNKKKENSFISEVDDSRVLVYDFRRRTNLLFENYRACLLYTSDAADE